MRVIIDTDIGSDIDDAFAIALALASKDVTLEGITTVYGDTALRARLVRNMLQIASREDVNVFAGLSQPLLRSRPVWTTGQEADGILTPQQHLTYSPEHGVDALIRIIMENPGEITVIAIGPLTNLAAAIIRAPEITGLVKQIVLMGGVTRLGPNAAELDRYLEHNMTSDPEAAAVVFQSGAPITMVGLDVTNNVRLTKQHRNQLAKSDSPLNQLIVTMLDRWFDYIQEDTTPMHDPLAVAVALNPSLVTKRAMQISVSYDHSHPSGQTIGIPLEDEAGRPLRPAGGETTQLSHPSGPVEVCLDVDETAFFGFFLNALDPEHI